MSENKKEKTNDGEWGSLICPFCRSENIKLPDFDKNNRCFCNNCKKEFSLEEGLIF